MATPIGTIPNAVMIGFLKENHNIEIDFVSGSHSVSFGINFTFLLFGYLD